MSQSVLSVRMDDEMKDAFSRFCEEAGLSVSAAVNLFVRQTVRNQAIPFPITLKPMEACSHHRDAEDVQSVVPLAAIKRAVVGISKRYPAVERVTLFGSYARGDADPLSDVDVRIRYDKEMKFSMFDLSGYALDLEEALGKKVDVITLDNVMDEPFEQAIERDGVVLYEREEQ